MQYRHFDQTLVDIAPMIQQANREARAGSLTQNGMEILIETDGFLRSAKDVGTIVLGAHNQRPVYLRDVATIHDGIGDRTAFVLHTDVTNKGRPEEAVTLTVAKRPGTNAVTVAEAILARTEMMKGTLIPDDVSVTITRHYGDTAKEKSNELLFHMLIAVVSVIILIWFTLGHRESYVVAFAIPVTLALTLTTFYLYGYTLNRITLFALIFSIGILVDDAIVVVENVVRHYRLEENHGRSHFTVAIEAVDEVGNPTILATLAVIAAILPMAFVGGLMGPYMRPIPMGASAAMFFSLLVAFIVTPWASVRMIRPRHGGDDDSQREDWSIRIYRKVMVRSTFLMLWRENTHGLTRSGGGSMFSLPESVRWIQGPVKLGGIILMNNHYSEP